MVRCACRDRPRLRRSATILPGVDREEIERPGFPVGRRGYDQAPVDAHLRKVADELERLRDRPAPASLAAGASEQVRLILEAAERGAAELRDDAGRQAGDHVERVEEAAEGMLRRLEELQGELAALLDGLRGSGERLAGGLADLQARVAELHPPAAEGHPSAVAAADAGGLAPDVQDSAAAAPALPANGAPPPADETGARITALNMALGGSPREETAAYLAEHFTLADPEALLADVYARTASEGMTSAAREAGRPQGGAG